MVLKFNHDHFNWSQEVLIVSIDILGMDTRIDLENNRIDAVIRSKNTIKKIEHKFIGLITKRLAYTAKILAKVKNQIDRKNLDLTIVSTLTSRHSMTDDLLLNFDVCLHVILLDGEYMASTKSEELANEVLNTIELGMDEDEDMITPIQAQMMIVLENQQKLLKQSNKELSDKIINLEENYKDLKQGNEELKQGNEELKLGNKELRDKIDSLSKFIHEKLGNK